MISPLLEAVRRYADAHSDLAGVAQTAICGLTMIRASTPSELDYAICRPLACLVVQGTKQVTAGTRTLTFSAGDLLLIATDVPTVSQVVRATPGMPYYSLVFDLDLTLIADLIVEMKATPPDAAENAVEVRPTEPDVINTALRLVRLLDRPASIAVLQAQLKRELHYWLLCGAHGAAIRQLGWPEGPHCRISRAVALLRSEFMRPLPVDRLAAEAAMSPSSFHHHFRSFTSLSPVQFQKQLRLIEARRLMVAQHASASSAAYTVGYESVSQFSREYRRLFGKPPAQDVEAIKGQFTA